MFVLRALHSFAARPGAMKTGQSQLQPKLARAATETTPERTNIIATCISRPVKSQSAFED